MADAIDDLDLARALFPEGSRTQGRVSLIPQPGVIGLFVELDHGRQGFVDVLNLPFDPQAWPPVGTNSDFEVLQHTIGQVRL